MSGPYWIKLRAADPRFAAMRAFAKKHGIPFEIHDKANCPGTLRFRVGAKDDRLTTYNPTVAGEALQKRAGVQS